MSGYSIHFHIRVKLSFKFTVVTRSPFLQNVGITRHTPLKADYYYFLIIKGSAPRARNTMLHHLHHHSYKRGHLTVSVRAAHRLPRTLSSSSLRSGMKFIQLHHSPFLIHLLKVKFHQPCLRIKGHSVCACVCAAGRMERGTHSCNYCLCVCVCVVYVKVDTVYQGDRAGQH